METEHLLVHGDVAVGVVREPLGEFPFDAGPRLDICEATVYPNLRALSAFLHRQQERGLEVEEILIN
jgi:hypothetical protein